MDSKEKKQPKRKRVQSPLAKNLQALMERKGLSLRAVAEICGVNPAMVHTWLNGAQPQNMNAILKLCNATGEDFQFVLTGVRKDLKVGTLKLEELFEVEAAPDFSGLFLIEAKRLKRRQ